MVMKQDTLRPEGMGEIAMKPMRPSHLSLGVSDLDRSERFYREALGLRPQRIGGDAHIDCGGFLIVLTETPPAGRAKFHFGFKVASASDVDAWAAHAKAHGARLDRPHDRDGGRVVFINDPDDYVIEIYYE